MHSLTVTLHEARPREFNPTLNQKFLRERVSRLTLRVGVRLAVQAFFHFTHRARHGEALWCASERVWMGRRTYLHWALHDSGIDIPWLVAQAVDAPAAERDREKAVREELLALWTEQMRSLPRKSTPHWLPLP
jgi:hypothetical protein